MLLSSFFIGGSTRQLGIASAEMLGLPDEVLEQISLVLGKKKKFGLLDHLLKIRNELATLFR